MAKTNQEFDQFFREKLEGHQEKPSALAWERLESQLPKSSKSGWGVWWAIAASFSALVMVAYLNWPSADQANEEKMLAQTEETLIEENSSIEEKTTGNETSEIEANSIQENTEIKSQPKPNTSSTQKKNSPIQKVIPSEKKADSFIAQAENPSTEKAAEPVLIPELKVAEPDLTLPELKTPDLTKTVASAQTEANDEPLYRVNIYSNGIKKGEPAEKNLITELGKTVGQVEGLLGKVDEGFAEIQDRKDNLFATLTSKRDRAEK
ncbi:hypothetical protein DFQ04_2706 [Algoriphagus boseongensis]|uniref:Uncharacterized protein n=1 Tax=Algoriphagus boseongensis TaxID=1442587 RepID=A0A4R6T532_9BACT|nr:hypothetical protein [Algoriphagus boseongensis]TDQ16585.1 hypothetical protein DFQ04_2706 [Algoriphagus boseongensis]